MYFNHKSNRRGLRDYLLGSHPLWKLIRLRISLHFTSLLRHCWQSCFYFDYDDESTLFTEYVLYVRFLTYPCCISYMSQGGVARRSEIAVVKDQFHGRGLLHRSITSRNSWIVLIFGIQGEAILCYPSYVFLSASRVNVYWQGRAINCWFPALSGSCCSLS